MFVVHWLSRRLLLSTLESFIVRGLSSENLHRLPVADILQGTYARKLLKFLPWGIVGCVTPFVSSMFQATGYP